MEVGEHKRNYLKETAPKIRETIRQQKGVFSELVILVGEENGALSEADGYHTYWWVYCT